jgi:type IV secretion system protein VirB4
MHARTDATTPFRLDLHQGDVGHALVVGPTGAGKSVLLNMLALQWRRYPDARVVIFDKGRSSRASSLLVGGSFYDLGPWDDALAFQPLARIDRADERVWAQDWLLDLLAASGVETTPQVKDELWKALANLAAGPSEQRTLTVLAATVQDLMVKAALKPFTLEGPHGRLLDAAEERLTTSAWQAFELGSLMESPAALGPVLTYLFHVLERGFDGRPTLIVLDEAWRFLESTTFALKIREWLWTVRKLNVSVVFSTLSLSSIAGSPIAAALMEGCPTRIFLPNPEARMPAVAKAYAGFGLNDQQIAIIAGAAPKREYYYQSAAGNRLFELGLGPIALAAAGSSGAADQALISRLLDALGPDGFAAAFFRAKDLGEVGDFLEEARDAA